MDFLYMIRSESQFYFILIISALLTIASCQTQISHGSQDATIETTILVKATQTVISQQIPSTETVAPAVTSTEIPSSTPSLPITQAPSPLPTLRPDEAQNLVLELFENNANCKLPCWWGIIPGKTAWTAARQFLETIAIRLAETQFESDSPLIVHSVYLPLPEEIKERGFTTQGYYVVNGEIDLIVAHPTNTHLFSIPAILSNYGAPSEVLLRTYNAPREGILPFILILYYPEQGFMVSYRNELAELDNDSIKSCFEEHLQPVIWIWDSDRNLSLLDLAKFEVSRFNSEDFHEYLTLEQATQMSIESFSQKVFEQDGICLESQESLWGPPT
jgi:hypothetical protein